ARRIRTRAKARCPRSVGHRRCHPRWARRPGRCGRAAGDGRVAEGRRLMLFRRFTVVVPAAALALVSVVTAARAVESAEGPIRFRPVHVYVDPAGAPLAAYQLEIVVDGNAMIVGVEGGEHPAFARPPHYDPAALAGGRIILAAFDTGTELPTQRTRVATVHMR